MDAQTVALICLICTVLGAVIGVLTFSKNRDKDVKSDAAKNAIIETKLDSIGQSVDSIRIDFRASDQKWDNLSRTVIRIDESVKSAHNRIDNLEKVGR